MTISSDNNTNWIWLQNWETRTLAHPVVVYFRKRFHDAGRLRISANCRYKLYINGIFVQEGPQKGTLHAAYADPAEVKEYLSGKENVAAIEVLYYPVLSSQRNDSLYESPYPCLYVEDLGKHHELDGKNNWRCHVAGHIQVVKEYADPAPICGCEIVHADNRMQGWMGPQYDDSWWQDSQAYSLFDSAKPFAPFALKTRTIPRMLHEERCFEAVMCIRENSFTSQTSEDLTTSWQQLLHGDRELLIAPHSTQVVEISAGEEMCGYPLLQMTGGRGSSIEFLYAESYGIPQPDEMTPKGSRPVPPLKQDRLDYQGGSLQGNKDYYHVAGYGTEQEPETYEPYLFRTFRFIQLQIHTEEKALTLKSYRYRSTGYPLQEKTRLQTSDTVMNEIWNISVRTLKRCMHETYVDCPYFEQLQYAMDSRAEILYTYWLSADDTLARACLESFRQSQLPDGLLTASAPAVTVNIIPGFSLYYVFMLHDHMMYFGDRVLIREHMGCTDRILEFFHTHLTGKGLVGRTGGVLFASPRWSFIDWCRQWNETLGVPPAGTQGEGSITMESLLYLRALQCAAELAVYVGREGLAQEYRERSTRLKEAVTACCTGTDGLIQDGPGVEQYSVHCQAWAILTGVIDSDQGKKNLERTLWRDDIPQCSVSMSLYLLEAMKKANCMQMAERLWEPWRWMVANHMTTCVENFTDQRSDCHAWGALILYALPAIYLGIRPTEPGFAAYEQKPELSHLEWIHGEIATPAGMIRV